MWSQFDMDIIVPLITLVAGTLFGLLTSLYIAYLQHKRDINIKIIEQYFEARGQLCDELSVLATLQVVGNLEMPSLPEHVKILSKLFYKYYDFLPPEVLKEMLCLHACLSDNENSLYKHKDNCLVLMEERDFKDFVERVSLVDNFKYYALIPLKSKDPCVRRIAAINYQARSVLVAINHYFTIQNLVAWDRYLRKSRKSGVILYKGAKERHLFYRQGDALSKVSKEVHANHIELQMCTIIAALLGVEEIRPNDDLFEVGRHSLLAAQLVARVRQVFNVDLPLSAVFEFPTPRGLATEVESLMLLQLGARELSL